MPVSNQCEHRFARRNEHTEGGKMTHAEEIMRAVAALIRRENKRIFSRKEVRDKIGLTPRRWLNSYTSIFQGMRSDHPGGAPRVRDRFKDVFRQVKRGKHMLTRRGNQLLTEFE